MQMTNSRLEEVRQDRHNAVFKEKRLKARQRKGLMAVAASLVENAEVGSFFMGLAAWLISLMVLDFPSLLDFSQPCLLLFNVLCECSFYSIFQSACVCVGHFCTASVEPLFNTAPKGQNP